MTWWDRAACRGWDTALFFPERQGLRSIPRRVAAVCAGCPVRRQCEAHAVANGEQGIWGGRMFHQKSHVVPRDKAAQDERHRHAIRARELHAQGFTIREVGQAMDIDRREARGLLRLVPRQGD